MRTYRKGQFVICKYEGDNGDLIVGCVESVRTGGQIVLKNLLSQGPPSIKNEKVLLERNLVVPKEVALSVVEEDKLHGHVAARKKAVEIYRAMKTAVKEQPAAPTPNVERMITEFMAMSDEDKAFFSMAVYKEVLAVFGVR